MYSPIFLFNTIFRQIRCFPHFTKTEMRQSVVGREAQVSKAVNCPGELSRQEPGSGDCMCIHSPEGGVEIDSLQPLLTNFLVFK